MKDLTGPAARDKGVPVRWRFFDPLDGVDFLTITRVRDQTFHCTYEWPSSDYKTEYSLRTLATLCHFGGSRLWFECTECGRLSYKLYLRRPKLVCRKCAGITYETQRMSASDRLQVRIDKVRAKLGPGGLPGSASSLPGMHHKTYVRLMSELRSLEARALADADEWIERMTRIDKTDRGSSR